MNISLTARFKKEGKPLLKKYRSLADDIDRLIANLTENPFQGVHLGKDCYKIRLAILSKGRGKSSGGRVITCVKVLRETIFLLSIYDKSARENLPDHELDELLREAGLSPEE